MNTTSRYSPRPRLVPAVWWLALLLGTDAALAQSHPSSAVRWGQVSHFDTAGREQPISQISGALGTLLVLRADGRVFANGGNLYSGSTGIVPLVQFPVPPPGLTYTKVSMGGEALLLRSDGIVQAFGPNFGGSNPLYPQPPLPSGRWYIDICAGGGAMYALRNDLVLVAWGNNYFGQLNAPTLPPRTTIAKLAAHGGYACILLSDGNILAWGDNQVGQCNVPPLPSGVRYVDVSCGNFHAAALRSDGQVVCWGDNVWGQCVVPPLPPGMTYLKVDAATASTIAVRSDGQILVWSVSYDPPLPTPVPAGRTVVQLEGGTAQATALLSDGTLMHWGPSDWHEGYVPGRGPGERWIDASCGAYFSAVLRDDGTIHAFGQNDFGQCAVPPLPAGLRYTTMDLAYTHGGAMRSDGQLILWGNNALGQCTLPGLPPGVTYTRFALGHAHTQAVRSDGLAAACGASNLYWPTNQVPAPPPGLSYVDVDVNDGNALWLLSDGTLRFYSDHGPVHASNPTSPPAGRKFVDIASARNMNAALLNDGNIVLWSAPLVYQGDVSLPALPSGVSYVEVTAGDAHFAARRSDGQVVVFGRQILLLGHHAIPTLLPGTSFVGVSAYFLHTVARIGPTSTYVTFANGCAGSLPATRIIPRDTPRIGAPMQITLFDLPQNVATLVVGWNRLATPISLTALGLQGCQQWVSVDVLVPVTGSNQTAELSVPIPNSPSLVGMHFSNQAVVLDPGANAAGAVVSDAAEGVIGHW